MNTETETVRDIPTIVTDTARSLINTAHEELSAQAEGVTKCFSTGQKKTKKLFQLVRKTGSDCGTALDQELQDHSFRYLAIVGGIGALLGIFMVRRYNANRFFSK